MNTVITAWRKENGSKEITNDNYDLIDVYSTFDTSIIICRSR